MTNLLIAGMTCGHCTSAVRRALSKVPGVTRVIDVDLASGKASVEGAADEQALVEAVREEGYQATLA